jgi:hypothetical protein
LSFKSALDDRVQRKKKNCNRRRVEDPLLASTVVPRTRDVAQAEFKSQRREKYFLRGGAMEIMPCEDLTGKLTITA